MVGTTGQKGKGLVEAAMDWVVLRLESEMPLARHHGMIATVF